MRLTNLQGEAEGELGCCGSVQPISLDLDLKRNHEEQRDHVRSVRYHSGGLARKAPEGPPAQKLPQGTHFSGVRDTRVTCQHG